MDDNQIRIPSADGIKPTTEELFQLYSCLANYQTCSYAPLKEIPPVFLDKYETSVQSTSDLMTPFPTADNRRLYSTSSDDPTQQATGRQIVRQTTDTIFDTLVETLQDSCPQGIKQLLPELHDGLYWAKRGGLSDTEIQEKLNRVNTALEPCLNLPPEPTVSEPSLPPPVVSTEPLTVEVEISPASEKKFLHLFFEGISSYHFDSFHSVDLTVNIGLRYLLGTDKQFIVQGGMGANMWGSPSLLNSDSTSQKDTLLGLSITQLFLAGGYTFSEKGPEILLSSNLGVLQKNQTTYDLQTPNTPPIIQQTGKFDVDLNLQTIFYGGLVLSCGYRVGESFHAGLGYELLFQVKKPKFLSNLEPTL